MFPAGFHDPVEGPVKIDRIKDLYPVQVWSGSDFRKPFFGEFHKIDRFRKIIAAGFPDGIDHVDRQLDHM